MTAAPGRPTVVFDLGEVLVSSDGLVRALAREIGTTEAALHDVYWAHRGPHDRGEPPLRYWTTVFTELGLPPDPVRMGRAETLDVTHWSTLSGASTRLIGALARSRVRLALLSNAPLGLAAAVRAAAWSGPFDRLLFSADVGVAKPSPDIYARADHEFRTRSGQVVFFDDRSDNVRAARAHGWDAHVWRGAPSAIAVLRERGIALPGEAAAGPPDGQG